MTPDFSLEESELVGEIFETQEESTELNEDTDVLDFIGVGEMKPDPFEFIGVEQEDPINVPNDLVKKEKCETDLEFDNDKPIGCPSCEVRFVSKWNMKQHFESVHVCLVHVICTERRMLKLVFNVKYLLLLSFLTAAEFYNLGHILGFIRVH